MQRVDFAEALLICRTNGAIFDVLVLRTILDPENNPRPRESFTLPFVFPSVSISEKISQEGQETQNITCTEQLESELDVVESKALIFLAL